MKNMLLLVLQFVLFLATFAVGSFLAPMRLRQVLSVEPGGTHIFVWDGVVWVGVLFGVILLLEAAGRRLRSSAPWTAAALIFALIAGLVLQLGFMTV